MTRPLRLPGGRFAIMIITIFAITGTLSSCGRYGSPVRVAPAADSVAQPVEPVPVAPVVVVPVVEEDEDAASPDAKVVDESSDQSE